jgi:hypothetical protein
MLNGKLWRRRQIHSCLFEITSSLILLGKLRAQVHKSAFCTISLQRHAQFLSSGLMLIDSG